MTSVGIPRESSAAWRPAIPGTPWLGIVERIMIYAYLLWVAVLAVALLIRDREGGAPGSH